MVKIKDLKIDITTEYDYDLGTILFRENFKHITKDLHTYEWSEMNTIGDVVFDFVERKYCEDLGGRKEVLEYYEFLVEFEAYAELEETVKDTSKGFDDINRAIDDLIDLYLDDLVDDFNNGYKDIVDVIQDLEQNDFIKKGLLQVIFTRGYSQGDYAEVIVNVDEFKQYTGAEFDYDKEREFIDQIFWETPLYFNVVANFTMEVTTEMGDTIITKGVENDFCDIEEVCSAEYYKDYDEIVETANRIGKDIVDVFNKKYKTSFKVDDVEFNINIK